MIKHYTNFFLLALSTILIITATIITSCNKSDSLSSNLTKDQLQIQSAFSSFKQTIGDIDLSTVKTTFGSDPKLYVISALIKGLTTKRFFLKVDERASGAPDLQRFLFESNVPSDLKKEEYQSLNGNGFLQISSLDINSTYRIEYSNGKCVQNKIQPGSLTTIPNFVDPVIKYPTPVGDPIGNCIKKALDALSFGEMLIFIVTMPDSMGLLIIACTITVVVSN